MKIENNSILLSEGDYFYEGNKIIMQEYKNQ